jgi:hypothetical protein
VPASPVSGFHLNDVEFGCCGGSDLSDFSVLFSVAVEVLLDATSMAHHEEVQAAVEKSVFAQLSVSVTPVGFYELGICGQFWLVGLGIV